MFQHRDVDEQRRAKILMIHSFIHSPKPKTPKAYHESVLTRLHRQRTEADRTRSSTRLSKLQGILYFCISRIEGPGGEGAMEKMWRVAAPSDGTCSRHSTPTRRSSRTCYGS